LFKDDGVDNIIVDKDGVTAAGLFLIGGAVVKVSAIRLPPQGSLNKVIS
jgi:hypothetical protein